MHPFTSLKRIASHLPFTYTGADFYALCSDAMLKAVTRAASAVDEKIKSINGTSGNKISTAYFFDHYATKEDIEVQVTEEDFLEAMKELVPSVSAKELDHYKKVREQFESVKEHDEDDGKKANTHPKIPEWQRQSSRKEEGEKRPSLPIRSSGSGKGKGKVVMSGKGKGKAREYKEEEYEDEDGDYYAGGVVNGSANGKVDKRKGKAVDMGFGEEEEEDIYS